MPEPKYYDAIKAAQAQDAGKPPVPDFSLQALAGGGIGAKVAQWVLNHPRPLYRLLRAYFPIAKLGRLAIVTRYDDVREVLTSTEAFETPFGLEMAEMAGGKNFVLGMADSPEYRAMKAHIGEVFRFGSDPERIVKPLSRRVAEAALERGAGRIDVVKDLISFVPVRICQEYYGVEVGDAAEFADWSISLSMIFFADPMGDPKTRAVARAGALRMREAIAHSVAKAKAAATPADTIVGRLVALQRRNGGAPDDASIASILMGMIAGFIPTNTLAGGNILDVLSERKDALAMARAAAEADDDERLWRCLLEALRFKPPLNPGVLRYTTRDHTIAAGQSHARTLPAGTVVMVGTASAMFDKRRIADPDRFDPGRFDPARTADGKVPAELQQGGMIFGHGLHWCIGAPIAKAQLVETFKALLKCRGLKPATGRAGEMTKIGPFARSQILTYEPLGGHASHAFLSVCIPTEHDRVAKIEAALDQLGNPAGGAIKAKLDALRCIHFASCHAIAGEVVGGVREPSHLVLELSADGDEDTVIDRIAGAAGNELLPLFRAAGVASAAEEIAPLLRRHKLTVTPRWGKTHGLCFSGTPAFTVKRILKERALVGELRQQIDPTARPQGFTSDAPLPTLSKVRSGLRQPGHHLAWALEPDRVPFTDVEKAPWTKDGATGWGATLGRIVSQNRFVQLLIALPILAALVMTFVAYAPDVDDLPLFARFGAYVFEFGINFISVLIALAVVLATVGGIVLWQLRRLEQSDRAEDRDPDPDLVREVSRRENAPGSAQNHMADISTLKPGRLRQNALLVVFYAVEQLATYLFRPGFLADIGTIHFARWIRLPGTNKLAFFSNYGGSFESYLEDFITKAHQGVTAVWSNTQDFPRARFISEDGAKDGDRFKRWARRQQRPTRFWYSAYPDLTTDQIRTNALIRDGLARASTESEADAWLSLFASVPRPSDSLETHEMQSLVFGGMGRLVAGTCLLVTLPQDRAKGRAYLDTVRRRVVFGDQLAKGRAVTLAISGHGLRRLGFAPSGLDGDDTPAEGGAPVTPISSFPAAFWDGMASRAAVLGDVRTSAPSGWAWGGVRHGRSDATSIHVALLLFAADLQELAALRGEIVAEMGLTGAQLAAEVHLATLPDKEAGDAYIKEPFGFADGLSNPVIRGSRAHLRGIAEQHVLEAGELVLGYPDSRGTFPPTPNVLAQDDPADLLPSTPEQLPTRYPEYKTRMRPALGARDIGRNGTYLVLRQLYQDVPAFHAFTREAAKDLGFRYGRVDVTPEWVGARLMGRWQDGTPLVRSPDEARDDAGNDFMPGREDPQGMRCPFGAHIRRANPRDSFRPGDPDQLGITNRHRIFRTSRAYVESADPQGEAKGILFMCLNADLERQFEFVQQTWLASPAFMGLPGETDPIVAEPVAPAHFTIPQPGGALTVRGLQQFVTVVGGEYFFLPGRRALQYLARPQHASHNSNTLNTV